jgi:DNA repair protein RAD5
MSIEELTFSPAERRIYEEIYASAKKDFGDLDETGTVTKNFAHMFGKQDIYHL